MKVSRKAIGIVLVVISIATIVFIIANNNNPNEKVNTDDKTLQETELEAKKALLLLSDELQNGVEGVEVLETFDETQNLIFKKEKDEK